MNKRRLRESAFGTVVVILVLIGGVLLSRMKAAENNSCSAGTKETNLMAAIEAELARDRSVFLKVRSPDGSAILYASGDANGKLGQAYLWKVGETEAHLLLQKEDRIGNFLWSPDSR